MQRAISFWTVLAGLCLAGCSDASLPPGQANSSPPPAPTSNATEAVATTTGAAQTSADIPLAIKSWEQVQEWVATQKGKIVVIDVWSTSCVTCVEEFPHFVEFHRKYGDKIACASLSVDFFGGEGNKPEDVKPQVEKFLRARQATMQNYISSDTDEKILQHLKTAAIPAAIVFDRDGKVLKIFNNDENEYGPEGFNYEKNIQPFVEERLASQ